MHDNQVISGKSVVPGIPEINEFDPAAVGLRTILRKNAAVVSPAAYALHRLETFDAIPVVALSPKPDRSMIELEIRIHELTCELEAKVARARDAVARAWSEGFATGRRKGAAEGAAEAASAAASDASGKYNEQIEAVQERMGMFLKNIEDGKRELFTRYEDLLFQLCCRMVKKILGSEPVQSETVVLPVLRKAMAGVAERERLVIRVSPADFETVSGNREFWAPVTERVKEISIEPDQRIERGGCIIESEGGIVDAQPGVQFDELSAIVERAWESARIS